MDLLDPHLELELLVVLLQLLLVGLELAQLKL